MTLKQASALGGIVVAAAYSIIADSPIWGDSRGTRSTIWLQLSDGRFLQKERQCSIESLTRALARTIGWAVR